jgi:UDP-N-acetylmuramyl pentapeptide phosphotransferase/UDP-N-acetylglucosamine-1-phosphate transferase
MTLAVPGILSFAVALFITYVLLARFSRLVLDLPNVRSMHERPVPRTGGIAVLLAMLTSLPFGAASLWLPLGAALALAALSFLDDLYGLPTALRLLSHIAAAGVIVWYFLSPMGIMEVVLLVLAAAWITNLYNFMDGSDGLAGGMSAIGFGAYAAAAYFSHHIALASLSIALAAGSAAFLFFNSHPARIFLGDVGSIPLGFLAAALGIVGWRDDVWPLWFPVLTFAPFIADATLTLVRRAVRGERVWEAHREHYYQRVIRMGLGHRKTAWLGYVVMAVCALAALFGRGQPPITQAGAFTAAGVLLAAMAVWVDLSWARYAGRGAK